MPRRPFNDYEEHPDHIAIFLTARDGAHRGAALVDLDDADRVLTGRRWRKSSRYAARHTDEGVNCYMHRLIMGAPHGMVVDHINNDGLDNRRCNLRVVTQRQNQWSRHKGRNEAGLPPGMQLRKGRIIIHNITSTRDPAEALQIRADFERRHRGGVSPLLRGFLDDPSSFVAAWTRYCEVSDAS